MTDNTKTQPHDQTQIDDKTILLLGGTGKTGRRVADRLTSLGRPVRIGSRSADPAFDWDDPGTWSGALDGIDAVYVTYYPDLAAPGPADASPRRCGARRSCSATRWTGRSSGPACSARTSTSTSCWTRCAAASSRFRPETPRRRSSTWMTSPTS